MSTQADAAPTEMPNLAGKSLVDAVKTLDGHEKTDVKDMDGQQSVTWPVNWKVCTQSPKDGAPLTEDTTVSLGVVKTKEKCPK
ncbi:PASTA domain-containing protein [Nocardia sp. CA-128927]|uniref:PASTA domain-containing protein n=1 Tax=Nocardia sp. CA-128927 TaxID=3239975 RepID=UPI003D958E13